MTINQQLSVQVNLPSGTWYDYYSGVSTFSSTEHAKLPVPTKLYQLPVFMRGGSVIMLYQGLTGTNSMKVRIFVWLSFEVSLSTASEQGVFCLSFQFLDSFSRIM